VKLVARRSVAAACALLAVGVLGATPADGGQPVGTPGADGAGDTYFPADGNGGYDVVHYDIHDTYRVRTHALHGWTDVSARATQDLSSFSLDLVLVPDGVYVDGTPATYAKADRHELTVTPATPIAAGSDFVVRVRYHGLPRGVSWDGERPFFADRTAAIAMNEPHIAPWWFPSDDHPQDKALFDIAVRVAAGNQVISNGTRVSHTSAPGWTTYHWRMDRPMASYLAFFAAGRFRVEHGVSGGLPWTAAVSRFYTRRTQDGQMRLMRASPGIVHWLETQFGPYPFDSTGGVVTSLFTGFALENQTRPTYPFLGTGHEAHSVVVHELAHQWFGDAVSVQRWRDIWLNEGFATWAEWRYDETHGRQSAWHRLLTTYALHPARDPFWRLRIADPGPDRIFDQPVYDRGAMTLQALRHRIGTSQLLTVLRTWTVDHAYANGTVEQFQVLAEQVSGQQLSAFFDTWLRTGAKPTRTVADGLR
jgi:aminopeptidase N